MNVHYLTPYRTPRHIEGKAALLSFSSIVSAVNADWLNPALREVRNRPLTHHQPLPRLKSPRTRAHVPPFPLTPFVQISILG